MKLRKIAEIDLGCKEFVVEPSLDNDGRFSTTITMACEGITV